jgi:hypothetical protein
MKEPSQDSWRQIEQAPHGLVSVCGTYVEFGNEMVWVNPLKPKEYREMKRAGFYVTLTFMFAYLILAMLA